MSKFEMIISLIFVAFGITSGAVMKNASISWNVQSKTFTIHDHIVDYAVANGYFTDEIFSTGWSFLEVKSSEIYRDSFQAYAAGLVEGYLTKELIKNHFTNVFSKYCDNEEAYCARLSGYLNTNMKYMNSAILRYRETNSYWHQVALILEQLSGIEDGYNNVIGQPRTLLNASSIALTLNLLGDVIELEKALNRTELSSQIEPCSALIKILPGYTDLYVSHDSWTSYAWMLRILKKYDLRLHTSLTEDAPVIPGHTIAFSSYPSALASMDDFNIISSGLVTTETTISLNNKSLWKYINPHGSILEWIRSLIANRLAKNGQQWTDLFSILNSGTYNNQWMIVDYKKFQSGKPPEDNLLWILEQMPGYIHVSDLTDVLRKQDYWPSYNVPYFKDIFNMSGRLPLVKQFGDYFTYEHAPRALIFKRDHETVKDIPSMVRLMRYNDYTRDPLSRCNCTPPYSAIYAIAARCDLNPKNGTFPTPDWGNGAVGAIDMKLTTSELVKKLQFIAFAGPTYDSLPPFQWSKSEFSSMNHVGQPDLWKFKPVLHQWI